MSNIRDILRELAVPYKENGQSPLVSGGWLGTPCPYCDAGRGKAGMGIHIRTLRASCWKCGSAWLPKVLADITGRKVSEVRALLGGLPPEREAAPQTGKLVLPPGIGDFLPAHLKYLRSRGFDPQELQQTWGIRAIGPTAGRLAWRVYIPVSDPDGKQVSWTTRAIGNVPHGERYRGASREQSSVPRSEVLCGEHLARHAVVVCEGFFDAARIGPGAVWTSGVGFSRAQVNRIAKYPVRVICFDSDAAAQRRADKLADLLGNEPGVTHVATLSGPDPASAPESDIIELRKFLE